MKDNYNHDKNTKINAIMLLQRKCLQLQIDKFQSLTLNHSIIQTNSSSSSATTSSSDNINSNNISNTLIQRFEIQKRILDDFEVTLIALCDYKGDISTIIRIQDLLYLMTRINKVDHRALCLEIICNHTPDIHIQHAFISYGGLRVLKKWIETAKEDDNIIELNLIITCLKQLPFNGSIVKETEIGHVIRKLRKYRGNTLTSQSDLTRLHVLVNEIMDIWTNKVTEENDKKVLLSNGSSSSLSDLSTAVSAEAMDLMEAINERLFALKQQHQRLESPNLSPLSTATTSPTSSAPSSPSKGATAPGFTRELAFAASSAAAPSLGINLVHVQKPTQRSLVHPSEDSSGGLDLMDVEGGNGKGVSTNNAAPKKAPMPSLLAAITANNKKGMELMADKAKKLIAAKELAEKMRTNIDDNQSVVSSATNATSMTLKSALKKPRFIPPNTGTTTDLAFTQPNDSGSFGSIKRPIRWADTEGGDLTQTKLFEVDSNFKRKTKAYHNLKDMAKKERMTEKNTNISKIGEAMQPTMKWVTPGPRVLSFDMRQYACGPIDSTDVEVQTKRLSHVLEAQYLDDSSVPAEPDLLNDDVMTCAVLSQSSQQCVDIPWLIADSYEDQLDTEAFIQALNKIIVAPPLIYLSTVCSSICAYVCVAACMQDCINCVIFSYIRDLRRR